MAQYSIAIGAGFGFFAVLLGAFGAHGLRGRVDERMLSVWKTACEYHFYHALALLLIGLLAQTGKLPGLDVSAGCFAAGIFLFSGSLYLMVLSGQSWMGAITPVGGLLFLVGWAWLCWSALRA